MILFATKEGDDAADGQTLASAKATIAACSAVAVPDTLIHIGPGVWDESISNPDGGTLQSPIVYRALDIDEPTVIRPSLSGHRPLEVNDSHLVFRGLIFDGIFKLLDCVKITGTASDVVLDQCVIRNGYQNGILTSGNVTDIVIRACRVIDNGRSTRGHGVYVTTPRTVVEDCWIASNAGWGIHNWHENPDGSPNPRPSDNTYRRNTIVDNGHQYPGRGAAIGLYCGGNLVAEGNTLRDNEVNAIRFRYEGWGDIR